jgi:hypothetical protein
VYTQRPVQRGDVFTERGASATPGDVHFVTLVGRCLVVGAG